MILRSDQSLGRLVVAALWTLIPALTALPPARAADDLTEAYREPAGRILGAALTDEEGWRKASHLTQRIGHRLSGSPSLQAAIDWAFEEMQAEGLDKVWRQPVKVPHWVRGHESATLLEPIERPLDILGLGRSVGTPEGGITAPVVVVDSFEDLEARGREQVAGKIVLYAVPWMGYGKNREYRGKGASRAAALGAVAALIRSATPTSLYTPHTGGLRYDEDSPQIPAAAVTIEDAAWLRALAEAGEPIVVHLEMEAQTLPDADSANVIAEITGSELPDEVVVIGGHYDSWDVGQGAHDDGVACIAAWHALTLLKQLGLQPRRTLRVVLWTAEEIGGDGGRAYRDWVGDDIGDHVAAIEMDGGVERPVGFGLSLGNPWSEAEEEEPDDEAIRTAAVDRLRQIGRLLEAIEAGEISDGGGGADIAPLMRDGVPGMALKTVGEHYFDWHHTRADTLDKIDPQNFRRAVAMFAVMGYVLADMPDRLTDPVR